MRPDGSPGTEVGTGPISVRLNDAWVDNQRLLEAAQYYNELLGLPDEAAESPFVFKVSDIAAAFHQARAEGAVIMSGGVAEGWFVAMDEAGSKARFEGLASAAGRRSASAPQPPG